MTVVAITGATGFIGSACARRCEAAGFRVKTFDRQEFDIHTGSAPLSLEGVDTLIHCAYDFAAPAELNVNAVRRLKDAAAKSGTHIVLLSSFSADARARSSYGRAKYASERLMSDACAAIVRPGLVVGNGGLFLRIVQSLRRLPLALSIGSPMLQTIYIDDLTDALVAVAAQRKTGMYTLAEPVALPLRCFYREIGRRIGRVPRTLTLPLELALIAARISRIARIPLPFDEERVLGLSALRPRTTDTSPDGKRTRTLPESLDAFFYGTSEA